MDEAMTVYTGRLRLDRYRCAACREGAWVHYQIKRGSVLRTPLERFTGPHRTKSVASVRSPIQHRFVNTKKRWERWLAGWTFVREPRGWLCPACGLTPTRSAAIALFAPRPGPHLRHADPPRWDYVFWHALARVVQILRRRRP